MSSDDRLARIEHQLSVMGPQIEAIATRLAMIDVTDAIADALAIRGLTAQINEVIHQQRIDLEAIANAQTASAAQGEQDRADITTLLIRLHALAHQHAARLTKWERGQIEASDIVREKSV